MNDTNEVANPLPGDNSLPTSADVLTSLGMEEKGSYSYSVEDFFRNPEKTGFQLSPDGAWLSWLGPWKNRLNIFVQEIGSHESLRLTNEEDRSISGYFWSTPNRLVYIKDKGGDENYALFAIDRDGKNQRDLTPFPNVRIEIIDDLEDSEDELIIGMNKNNPQLFEPYRINIHTGELKQLATNDNPAEPISFWKTDHQGKLRLAGKVKDGTNNTLLYRDSEEEPFREIITTDFRVEISPLFFDFHQPHLIYVSSNLGRDKSVITRFDMHQGTEIGEPLFVHPDVDVTQLHYSRKRKVLTSIVYNTDKRHRHFLDEKTKQAYENLENRLSGYEIFRTSHDKAEKRFIVRTYSDRTLGSYYLFDEDKNELQKITDVSPWLSETDMAPMRPVSFLSRDGLRLNGYLTLPVNVPLVNLPVVVNPHGGPWARDFWGFNPEVQLLANRGYAVLQINFRGSVGYGRKFWESSFKKWGQEMQQDITDGVHWLLDQGFADPQRIAIYGASYGGYATLAGVAFTPDLFACAIDYVGVSNLFTFMKTIPPYWKPYLEMMYMMVGHPEKDREMMAAASPALHVDKIKTPLFVVQGANDPRVNIDESDQIVRSLRQRGVDVPYMVKYDEGHGFHNEENRFEFYKAMLGFLSRYLK